MEFIIEYLEYEELVIEKKSNTANIETNWRTATTSSRTKINARKIKSYNPQRKKRGIPCYGRDKLKSSSIGRVILKSPKKTLGIAPSISLHGISIKIGNRPLVYNFEQLLTKRNKTLSPEAQLQLKSHDIYLIVHCIGAIRKEGKAKVDELQYHAQMVDAGDGFTLDLIPKTEFKKLVDASFKIKGALAALGSISAEIPDSFGESLTNEVVTIGGSGNLQLSSDNNFVGLYSVTIAIPTIQATGQASNSCSWVLTPKNHSNSLLGDQFLTQIVAVPKGTKEINYDVYGVAKVDKGLFWKTNTKQTNTNRITLQLPLN